ncbi:putative DNA-binding domain-containing protein (plasmid) [Gemmobacter fulvus]|uniref:DNA-binding domain-containing protein n=1 Tax=Gemmobacter fulvus TaxID=2840474 RepID=A0A975PCN5_9RHOB|nr:DNA-binding domain-containing protein [Gemmobacter fulvus]MBT9247627.1 putative DNA-binding domain-containing protein [Gemmobacter fulvus]QWK93193.1 putative DNA-binding domain-containing protein [Gemmobacter fulvus]
MPLPAEPPAGHAGFLAAFQAGLVQGGLPPGICASAPEEAALRFAVYRNTVTQSLSRALASRFAVIAQLLGDEFFAALAPLFSTAHPPQSPILHQWGAEFPAFLAGFAPLAGLPYLADVARLELARGQAYHAADGAALGPADLAQLAARADVARVALHPSVTLLRSAHAIVSIWARHQPGGGADPVDPAVPEVALILRTAAQEVPVWRLAPGDAAFVAALLAGAPLMQAGAAAQRDQPGHDPGAILLRLARAGVLVAPPSDPLPLSGDTP